MKTLYKWYLTYQGSLGFLAHGTVYGHSSPMCADGTTIHTSLIESAEYDGEAITLFTMNSEYRLSISEMHCQGCNAMRAFRVFERFARKFGLMKCLPQVCDHYAGLDEYFRNTRSELHSRLKDGSIYIELSDETPLSFCMAVYRTKSGESEFVPKITDIYRDGQGKVTASLDYYVDFHPYNDGNIEFVSHSGRSFPDREFLGIIKNCSGRTFNIRFSWGKTVILAPECEVVVSEGMGLAIPLTCTELDF